MYEPSFRTPLIMRWPAKLEAGVVNTDMVQNLDFAPTILDAAKAPVPDNMQGASMLPLLANETNEWRDELYYHYYEYPGIHMVKRHYGIKTKRYKLIHFYYDIDEWELYDLEKDPDEMNNLYGEEAYSSIQDDLHKRLDKLRLKYKDSADLDQQFIESDLARLKELQKQ